MRLHVTLHRQGLRVWKRTGTTHNFPSIRVDPCCVCHSPGQMLWGNRQTLEPDYLDSVVSAAAQTLVGLVHKQFIFSVP